MTIANGGMTIHQLRAENIAARERKKKEMTAEELFINDVWEDSILPSLKNNISSIKESYINGDSSFKFDFEVSEAEMNFMFKGTYIEEQLKGRISRHIFKELDVKTKMDQFRGCKGYSFTEKQKCLVTLIFKEGGDYDR